MQRVLFIAMTFILLTFACKKEEEFGNPRLLYNKSKNYTYRNISSRSTDDTTRIGFIALPNVKSYGKLSAFTLVWKKPSGEQSYLKYKNLENYRYIYDTIIVTKEAGTHTFLAKVSDENDKSIEKKITVKYIKPTN
ncbi:MAG: hypothetical protein ACEPOV_05950 [Hyphomicrobiales bacterium]